MISKSTIKEFQKVVKTETGVDLNKQEAQKVLTDLVGYFDLLSQIDHRINKTSKQKNGGRKNR